jgi:hypothetical protein
MIPIYSKIRNYLFYAHLRCSVLQEDEMIKVKVKNYFKIRLRTESTELTECTLNDAGAAP